MKYILAILSATISSALAVSPPAYIKACELRRPDFDKCALGQAKYAIPFLVKGDKERKIPNMTPLVVPLVELIQDNKWRMGVTNLSIYGFENITVMDVKMNKTNLKFTLDVDNLEASGRYEMNGRLIFLDLEGSGFCFVKFVKGSYTFDGTLTPYENNGKNYLRFGQPRVDYRVKRVHMQFENLLHKQFANTGINPSKILDDNWDMVMEDIDVPFKEVISTIVLDIVSSIMDDIPEKNVFLTM
ncbi:uncharacterized protein LOC135142901 [Zophobas morio]|uniref:uncharacterized protein LOC135142901 n=1 Tax=Zophobas morio TaxID=2755281 RepID=UPI00308386E8